MHRYLASVEPDFPLTRHWRRRRGSGRKRGAGILSSERPRSVCVTALTAKFAQAPSHKPLFKHELARSLRAGYPRDGSAVQGIHRSRKREHDNGREDVACGPPHVTDHAAEPARRSVCPGRPISLWKIMGKALTSLLICEMKGA